MSKSFYITTTLPYVNSDPHVGFAMEIVRADSVARWHKLLGEEVFFNTGTDEHGQKIWQKAKDEGKGAQEYVDSYAEKFKSLIPLLGITNDINFIRTTDEKHVKAAQEFWNRVNASGDIYKKQYSVKYCVGCELEKTDSELENGVCPIHPNLDIEIREEENYFFKFSKYQNALLEFYEKNPNFVTPDFRFNEIKAFVQRGLEDFSVSRLREKMEWGVPVPGDENHVMYVWFDALVSYISTLDWPGSEEKFNQFWLEGTPTQYAGKDNLRQQSAMWQAMLMSAKLPNSHSIVINGFITSGGQKMSKSLGNVIDPQSVVEKFGKEAFRYFVLRELSTFEDSDFTIERMLEAYNANLANGIGNLTSRIMKMAETNFEKPVEVEMVFHNTLKDLMQKFELQKAMNHIWEEIGELDRIIQSTEPFKLVKTDREKGIEIITDLVKKLAHIGYSLAPFMPETSQKILEAVKANKLESGLFPRME